jgi:hypothetical protein
MTGELGGAEIAAAEIAGDVKKYIDADGAAKLSVSAQALGGIVLGTKGQASLSTSESGKFGAFGSAIAATDWKFTASGAAFMAKTAVGADSLKFTTYADAYARVEVETTGAANLNFTAQGVAFRAITAVGTASLMFTASAVTSAAIAVETVGAASLKFTSNADMAAVHVSEATGAASLEFTTSADAMWIGSARAEMRINAAGVGASTAATTGAGSLKFVGSGVSGAKVTLATVGTGSLQFNGQAVSSTRTAVETTGAASLRFASEGGIQVVRGADGASALRVLATGVGGFARLVRGDAQLVFDGDGDGGQLYDTLPGAHGQFTAPQGPAAFMVPAGPQ